LTFHFLIFKNSLINQQLTLIVQEANMTVQKHIYLSVGTHKGGFVLKSDLTRKKWQITGPFFKGTDVNYMMMDLRDEPVLYACVNSSWWGPDIRFSRDFGETWQEPEQGIRFPEGSEKKVERVWYLTAGSRKETDVLYAGVDPGALFKSADRGMTWQENQSLSEHPSRDKWHPGMGGLMVHSICVNPDEEDKMHVGISAAGTFSTEDGGASWQPRNKGVLADFHPDKYPDVGQCVHHMEMHPAKPHVLYQQNHCGVYRSDDEGKEWSDLSAGLPSRFGFPLVIHPQDPDTIYVIPEEGPEFRCPVDGELAVFRSRNRGEDWQRLDRGLPDKNAYLNIYRHAMTTDHCDPAGIYFGTSTGQIFYSCDEGESWQLLLNWFPPVFSLSSAIF
jgi:photosystem II stability/assembly factor-like uncharacterized protein